MANRLKEYGLACQQSNKNVSIDVVRICRAYKSGNSTDAIARMYGISRWKVHHVLRHMGNCLLPKARKPMRVEDVYKRQVLELVKIIFLLQLKRVYLNLA